MIKALTVQDLINELMKIEDKSLLVGNARLETNDCWAKVELSHGVYIMTSKQYNYNLKEYEDLSHVQIM